MDNPQDSILIPKIETSTLPTSNDSVPAQDPPAVSPPALPTKKSSKSKMIWLGVGAFVLLFIIYNAVAGFLVYQSGMELYAAVKTLKTDADTKDLTKIEQGISGTKLALDKFQSRYQLISWAKFVPYFGRYVSDGGHAITAGQAGLDAGKIVLQVATPYADLLGLKTDGQAVLAATTGAQTMQQRIDFIVKTIPNLLPQIDNISAKVKIINDELGQIDASRYPENFKGVAVQSEIRNVQNTVSEAASFIVNGKPILENAPYLLGMDSPRTYMVLFQNDKELRPTGGFLTAYAIMKVSQAKFDPVSSSDIYSLDALYKPTIPAPAPIIKYIKGPYILSQNWRLRDMNWSPDFPTSMQLITAAASKAGVSQIDGVIAVDTQLLTNLLDVIGQIGVPGFGNFSTKINPQCNCADVIYQLESFADIEGPIIWDPITGKIILRPPNSDNRKKIIGPLMNSILANALGQPKEKLPALFAAGFKSLIEKHVLFYLMDNSVEKAVSDFGIGGVINQNFSGDYLAINDANLGGRKSNLYATEEVEQDINVAGDGSVTKTVTITYKNPESQDGWLNSVLPTWVRVYVPKGSILTTSQGLEDKTDPYEDLGHTVFAGYFQLRPEGVSKVTFQYKLPFKVHSTYDLLLQKQPGTDGFLYTVKIGNISQEFYLKADKVLKIDL